MAKLTVLLEDDLMYRFKLQALADRRSVSDVVRRFAEDYAGGVLAAGEKPGRETQERTTDPALSATARLATGSTARERSFPAAAASPSVTPDFKKGK